MQSLLINSYIDFVNLENTQRNEEQSSSMPGCSLEQQNSFESNEKTIFQHFRISEQCRRTSTDDSLTFDIWKYMLQPIADASLNQFFGLNYLEKMFRHYNTSFERRLSETSVNIHKIHDS